jgi:hypothetical protein
VWHIGELPAGTWVLGFLQEASHVIFAMDCSGKNPPYIISQGKLKQVTPEGIWPPESAVPTNPRKELP